MEPTKQREGDQTLPDGDVTLEDDQSLVIADIEARRQVGIDRYGQGHRPFNGRDTLLDMYEEQLDKLVYLRSILRMADATDDELTKVISAVLVKNGHSENIADLVSGDILVRLRGWVAATLIRGNPDA